MMQCLLPSELLSFASGLKERIFKHGQVDLISAYGGIVQSAKRHNGSVYVDNQDSLHVSLILVKFTTVKDVDDLDKFPTTDKESILPYLKDHSDTFIIWIDETAETDTSIIAKEFECVDPNSDIFANSSEIGDNILSQNDYLKRNSEVTHVCTCFIAYLNGDLNYFPCPDGYTLRPLNLLEGKRALEEWKFYPHKNMVRKMLHSVVFEQTMGAFHNESGELASYVFDDSEGSLSALNTKKHHRGKGLAKSVLSEIARRFIDIGWPVFLYIESPAEKNLFVDLGFTIIHEKPLLFWTEIGDQ